MPEQVIGVVAIALMFGAIPITAMVTYHQRKMAEIKARMGGANADEVKSALNAVRDEVSALRETTTKFDMSFDAAITRLEQRVDHIEEQVAPTPTRTTTQAESTSDVTVQVRR
jgi:cell division protein ZapA (FtsZ GTPase activity inhibitor)